MKSINLILLGIFTFLLITSASAVVIENYEPTTDYGHQVYDNHYYGQNFTLGTTGDDDDYGVTSVEIEINKTGSGMGDLYVEIYAVDGSGFPTGIPLAMGFISESNMPTSATSTEIPFNFGSNVLNASTKYVLTFMTMGDISNYVTVGALSTAPAYSGGNSVYTNDGGTVWNDGLEDIYFILNGNIKGTSHEYFLTGEDTSAQIYSGFKSGQTFTVGTTGIDENFDLSLLKFKLAKIGNGADITISLYAVNSGLPTGLALSTNVGLEEYYLTGTPTWTDVIMSAYELQASTEYAITFEASDGDSSNYITFELDTNNGYAGGTALYDSEGWAIDAESDFLFEVYGAFAEGEGPPAESAFEYYEPTVDFSFKIYTDNYIGQSFTIGTTGTNEDVVLTLVKAEISKVGTIYDDLYIEIFEVDGSGFPIGMSIAFQHVLESNITTTPTIMDVSFLVDSATLLTSTKYALIFSTLTGDSSNYYQIGGDELNASYNGGNVLYTLNGGTNWSNYATDDLYFKLYGTPLGNSHIGLTTGDIDIVKIYPNFAHGQTFTPTEDFNVSLIKIKASKTGNTFDVDVALSTTTNGLPTGPTLATGAFPVWDLTGTPTWTDIHMSPYELQNGVEYALTFMPSDGDINNYIALTCAGDDFVGGDALYTESESYTWYTDTFSDLLFEIYGDPEAIDSTPPSTSIVSIGGDTSDPYVDITDDNLVNAVIAGEVEMVCRWDTTDIVYASMGNECSIDGSDATCPFGDLANDSYFRYVSCNDSLGNPQTTENNLDLSFDVDINESPTLTSVDATPDPVKGGSTVTITPTGPADGDLDDLYYYCDSTTTPTSANTNCSEANESYASPYSGMICTYNAETDDTTHTIYCRTYDGKDYSDAVSTTYVTDSTAPSTSITSVGGDTSDPYVDVTNDNLVNAIIAGESEMVCRWDSTDLIYNSMANACSIDGSNATCAFGDLGNGSYTRYVSCNDSLGNAQTTGTNLDIDFDVSIDDAPVLTSISVAPSPLKGGNTITVTPSGVSDAESGDLNFFCAHSTTPTSGSNICTEADANYSTPYSGMICTASSLINDIENTVYCRVFDATSYSNEQTDTYVSDSTPPSLTTTSVAGDGSAPFVDVVNDELTAIVASGEVDMVCRWASTDIVYSSMVNDCSIDSNNTTCNVIGLGQGNYERYVSCVDSLGNANAVDDNLDINFTIDWNDQPIISDVNSTGGIITQEEDVDFSIAWSDGDGEDVKAHVCKTDAITVQVCNGGAWVEESSFDSVTPIEISYTTSISDFGTLNYYVFVCDVNDLCSVSSSGSFKMNVSYDPTYIEGDIPPVAFDFLGGVLTAFVLMVPIIGLSMIVIWIRA